MQDPSHMFNRAADLHRKGDLAAAEGLYLQLLKARPNDFDVLQMLGFLRYQQGRFFDSLSSMGAALKINSNSPAALLNYAVVLDALQRREEALANYDKALAIKPDYAEALFNRGIALRDLKRPAEAVASYDRLLALKPDDADALNNRGNALRDLKRPADAVASYDRALAIKPDYADALNNRGNALRDLDRTAEALASYDKALAIRLDYVEALNNRGSALRSLNCAAEAVASYDKAIALKPDYAEAFNNRGIALQDLKRFDQALASYEKAIVLKPDYAEAFNNRGQLLKDGGKWAEAIISFERALAFQPDYADAKFSRCMAQLPLLYMDEPEIAQRRTAYDKHLGAICDEMNLGAVQGDLIKGIGSFLPFYLPYQGYNDRELQSRYGSLVCRLIAERYPPAALTNSPGPNEPVRVGIVSGFFRSHAVWRITAKGWLSQLDRQRFKTFGYYTGNEDDEETKAGASFCDRFVKGPLPLDRWRQQILADAPHVLIYPEIGIDAVSAQLAAQRLAPVQCNSWGHPETSGFPTIDYFLSSDLMEPSEGREHYTERLIRLPNLSTYLEPLDKPTISLGRSDLGLRQTATVYWCGQSLYKYLPQFDQVFPRIAREAGDCQFVFIQYQLGTYLNELFFQRLDQAFAAFGLRAADHCVLLPRLDTRRFVAAIEQCDIVLDSIGWSGGNTTLDALTHDLPVVTMPGALMRGRHSMAFFTMMGVTEAITETINDYVSTAIRLARDVPWRMALKSRISENKHRIYRDTTCIAALEEFLNQVARYGIGAKQKVNDSTYT